MLADLFLPFLRFHSSKVENAITSALLSELESSCFVTGTAVITPESDAPVVVLSSYGKACSYVVREAGRGEPSACSLE